VERQRLQAEREIEERRIQAEQDRIQAMAQAERDRIEVVARADRDRLQALIDADRQRLEIIAASERERAAAATAAATAATAAEEHRIRAAAEVEKERVAACAAAEQQAMQPMQPVHTRHAATQPAATLARPVYAPSMPMHTMTAYTHGPTAPVVPVSACAPTMPMHLVSGAAPTLPALAMPAVHECTPAMSLHPMPGPATSMTDCTPAVPQPTLPVRQHTPRPAEPVLVEGASTVSTTSAATVHAFSQPEPTLPEAKTQPTTSLVVHHPTPPAPTVTQPQVVLIKQFQQPKLYSGSSSWKGYREYFERLAAVNGWSTPEQKVEQLALDLEGPATEVLRDLDTSHPQAYNIIWDALARRFGSLDGAREVMRHFDSRRQEDSETIPDFEQALRSLHREAWPTATPEQRGAALKRRFEDGLLSSDMVQFLRLHARDLDFQATVIKARQFADAIG